jgi:predicted ATP-binding protein involved in virulence
MKIPKVPEGSQFKKQPTTASPEIEAGIVANSKAAWVEGPNPEELKLLEEFTATTEDDAAGVIVRAAVNVARFRRTIEKKTTNSSQRAHMQRLISAVTTQSSVRLINAYENTEQNTALFQSIDEAIDTVGWEDSKIQRPVVNTVTPSDGTEMPINVVFPIETSDARAQVPA